MASDRRARLIAAALRDVGLWSRAVLRRPLRPYQLEAARGIARLVRERDGGSAVVMMSRQAGKNEVGAQLESWLLARYQGRSETIVKASPTFKPQTINSILRLRTMLENPLQRRRWVSEFGFIVRQGGCRIAFFSAGPDASVVGATASLLLEVDEAQDVEPAKFDKDFAPMAASTNAPRVFLGTAWTSETLLARELALARDRERRDGRRSTYVYDWQTVAEYVPAYGKFAEGERLRLGEEHPLFRTQYRLLPIDGETAFLRPEALALMAGDHPPRDRPGDGVYVAGIDVAGSSEDPTSELARERDRRKDSTVAMIGRVEFVDLAEGVREPVVYLERIVWTTGRPHREQQAALLELLRVWRCERVLVDATGIGAPTAEFLEASVNFEGGHGGPPLRIVEGVAFSAARKSELGYGLIAAANGGRVKIYRGARESDPTLAELWHELESARSVVKPSGLLAWAVPEWAGHDDMVGALALLVAAAGSASVAAAGAVARAGDPLYSQYNTDEIGEFK